MVVTLFRDTTVIYAQALNAYAPSVRTESGSLTEYSLQLAKARSSMVVSELPKVTDVRSAHPENADGPMVVMLSGRVSFWNLPPANARSPMVVTPSLMVRSVMGQPSNSPASMLVRPPPSFTVASVVQLLKAFSPMEVTLSGMTTDVRDVQPAKADSPMVVTPSGIVMDVRAVQL